MRTLYLLFALGLAATGQAQQWESLDGGADGNVRSLYADTLNNRLYACGNFFTIGQQKWTSAAWWDGKYWNPLCTGNNVPGDFYSIMIHKGDLVVAGNFDDMEGIPMNNLARCRNGVWEPMGNPNSSIQALEFENELYIKSSFDSVGGKAIQNFAKWTGTDWVKPFPDHSLFESPKFNYLTDIVRYKGEVILGGQFQYNTIYGLAYHDGTTWQPLSQEHVFVGPVEELAVYQGILYIGGWMSEATGNPANYLLAWDGEKFFKPFPEVNFTREVIELEVLNNELYISGRFHFGADTNNYVTAKFDGENFCAFGGSFTGSPSSTTKHLRIVNGDLYASTGLVHFGDTMKFIAKWIGTEMDSCIYNPIVAGINELSVNAKLSLSPNPVQEVLQITFKDVFLEEQKLEIKNHLGQVVKTMVLSPQGKQKTYACEVRELRSGFYYLSLGVGTQQQRIKFVKL